VCVMVMTSVCVGSQLVSAREGGVYSGMVCKEDKRDEYGQGEYEDNQVDKDEYELVHGQVIGRIDWGKGVKGPGTSPDVLPLKGQNFKVFP